MPAWWARKFSKNKEHHNPPTNFLNFSKSSTSSPKSEPKKGADTPRSFDDLSSLIFSRNSPRPSRDLASSGVADGGGGGSSGFSGFDSDSGDKSHPLPRPATPPAFGIDHGVGIGSGSVSVSSVSSSGSSDDHPSNQEQLQFGAYRGFADTRIEARPRSPGPGSRGPASPTSPLNSRFCGMSLESPTGKLDDGKSRCHKLPLPPSSPTSPSSLTSTKAVNIGDNDPATQSKWKRGRLLGRGTFGHVYLGFNSVSGQMCAIKEVKVISDDSTSKECLKQLNQEITVLSQLSHPNIVRYYGSEMGEESLSVYLEYISGGSIHKLLQEYGAFKEPVIRNYTRKILSGLAYLHGRNTVHRDIKGANILVDPNGEVKLVDFGMAKHMTNCTSMLSFKGSPYWMAPEVVMHTNGYSLAVDIWSLGCTVLEMATSKPPWSKYEGVAAIFKIGNSKDMPEIPDHLSYDAKNFVQLCLQRDPSARPSAAELLDHPFVQDAVTPRASDVNFSMDAFPFSFDGFQTPPLLDQHPNRKSISICDGDYVTNLTTSSRALRSPRGNARMITSLPVSPSSSPLRSYGPLHQSCYRSPPHTSYMGLGQSCYNLNEYAYNTRPNTLFTLDPSRDSSLLKVQTHGGSPRRPL
ncbi:mitogen-activated protein kinase kinase kinase 3-like isoform X1 [Cucurbita moschata]|uniref:mitogen-activated protein kinase kinase kinase n=1 Tax=Cucurbita moschata TaxID=3662 RepID=A0A6J1HE38_CUCMO|nr:mitogen-activated protein kinase kinase kinase 3-like isoform X1 [Cucurbita moschata]